MTLKANSTSSLLCLVLAAGAGTRMHSALPKVLHQLAGRAMVQHVLAAAASLEPAEILVVGSPSQTQLAAAVAPYRVVIQEKQLGTGDAVRGALAQANHPNADVLVLYGDTPLLQPYTLQQLVTQHRETKAAITLTAFRPNDPAQYGRVVADGSRVSKIVEFQDATEAERQITLCNGGIMLLAGAHATKLLAGLKNENAKGEYYLTDCVAAANAAGLACHYVAVDAAELSGVNNRAELAVAEKTMQQRLRHAAMLQGVTMQDPESVYLSFDTQFARDVLLEPQVYCGPGVRVGEGTHIKAFTHLEGVTIGQNAVIGPFARLRPDTVLADEVRVGNFVELKKAKLGKGAKVNHLTYLGDAQVGAAANIGAGTITCNYDGFRKASTKIGDGAFIGSNSALVAPVTIGDGAFVGAGSVITEDVPPDTLAVARGRQTNLAGWVSRFRGGQKDPSTKK